MKILHLTLKKKWFDMILSGEKKEEYREIKGHWVKRLCYENMYEIIPPLNGKVTIYSSGIMKTFKDFDLIHFKNGYSKNAPEMIIECKGISISEGNPHWGAPRHDVFIIKLGEISK